MKKPERILIVRTDRIGDVVLSTPVIASLRKAYPQSYLAFMCRPYTQALVKGNPYLDEVIVYDKYGKEKGFWATFRFARSLKAKKFDLALILHPTNRAHLVTFLAGIPKRVGWDRKLGFLLTRRIPHTKQEGLKHELAYTLDMLRSLAIEPQEEQPSLPEDKASDEQVVRLLKEEGVDLENDRLVGLGLGASCPSKIWRPEYFARLSRSLNEKGARIVVVAEEKERFLTERFQKEFGRDFVDLTGRLTLAQIFALFRRLSLFIGNDSGLIHICWAVKTPVISLFGRKNPGLSPQRWKPLGKDSFFFHGDIDCLTCSAHHCRKEHRCLDAIKPAEVLDKALEILKL